MSYSPKLRPCAECEQNDSCDLKGYQDFVHKLESKLSASEAKVKELETLAERMAEAIRTCADSAHMIWGDVPEVKILFKALAAWAEFKAKQSPAPGGSK